MQFKSIAFILACTTATGLIASPLAVKDSTKVFTANEYSEVHREMTSTGDFLVYYGPGNGTKTLRSEPSKVKERDTCDTTTTPTCSKDHSARNDVCDSRVSELQANGNIKVSQKPRHICYESSSASKNAYCCVSWSRPVSNLIKADLYCYADYSKKPLFDSQFLLFTLDLEIYNFVTMQASYNGLISCSHTTMHHKRYHGRNSQCYGSQYLYRCLRIEPWYRLLEVGLRFRWEDGLSAVEVSQ